MIVKFVFWYPTYLLWISFSFQFPLYTGCDNYVGLTYVNVPPSS